MAGVIIASSGRVEGDITVTVEAITMPGDLAIMADLATAGTPLHGEDIVAVDIPAGRGLILLRMVVVTPAATVAAATGVDMMVAIAS